jgi:hypothetical protein
MDLKSKVLSISPEVETFLGCGPKHSVSGDPSAALEANILLLKSGMSQVLIVSLDALYPGARLRSDILFGLNDLVNDESLFLSSSHTHNAPMLDDSKPLLGSVIESHYLMVARKIIAASKILLTEGVWASVELKQGSYEFHGVASRRRQAPGLLRALNIFTEEVLMLPNLKEICSTRAEILLFTSGEKILAMLMVGACHPVSNPELSRLSPDYVGSLREFSRDGIAGNSGMAFAFLQGASGEVRPDVISNGPVGRGLRALLFHILVGKSFGVFDSITQGIWQSERCEELQDAVSSAELSLDTSIAISRWEMPLGNHFHYEGPQDRSISVHAVRLGPLKLLGLSAEPTWDFAQNLRNQAEGLTLVGCIDDTYGYLPSRGQCDKGGYEVSGFQPHFSLTGKQPMQHLSQEMQIACQSAYRKIESVE